MKYRNTDYLDLMTFRGGRPMLCELFGPLVGLTGEWAAQGASSGEMSLETFGFDCVELAGAGGHCGFVGGQEEVVLEETDRFLITRDAMGRTMKLQKGVASIALPMDFPVRDMDDWLRIKGRFAFCEGRVDRAVAAKAAMRRLGGALTLLSVPGAFMTARDLMGDEALCLAFYDQPELLHDIFSTLAATSVEVIRRIGQYVTIDNLCIGEDLAGKSGPLLSPAHVREFLAPYYRAAWDAAREAGAVLFSQDSDGFVEPVMEAFIACGVNVFYPCEPAAGMDIVKLRRRFGKRCAFKGGIDKLALLGGPEDIERELQYKLTDPALRAGMVFGLDHRIPNGTPLENYIYYVETAREILGIKPAPNGERKFFRMAF